MRVWIDQNLCTGDGLCVEICPDAFWMDDDGLAYVKEAPEHFGAERRFHPRLGHPAGAKGCARVPAGVEEAVREAAEECPGECIFLVED